MTSPLLASRPATTALRQSPIPALRRLAVEESDANVVISGRVSSYYLKQLAQETVMPFLDRRALFNAVAVVKDSDTPADPVTAVR